LQLTLDVTDTFLTPVCRRNNRISLAHKRVPLKSAVVLLAIAYKLYVYNKPCEYATLL